MIITFGCCCRFEREIEVGVPDPAAREDILNVRWEQRDPC